VVVIGAGQAGLAVSHELSELGVGHVALERAWVGQTWRYLGQLLPGHAELGAELAGFPHASDDPEGFVPRDEIVGHLLTPLVVRLLLKPRVRANTSTGSRASPVLPPAARIATLGRTPWPSGSRSSSSCWPSPRGATVTTAATDATATRSTPAVPPRRRVDPRTAPSAHTVLIDLRAIHCIAVRLGTVVRKRPRLRTPE
jgi:hypothetical protein